MNKICTSKEQSNKLIELGIDRNTADMYYDVNNYGIQSKPEVAVGEVWSKDIPAWSLAALLDVLEHPRCFQGDKPSYWFCGCFDKDNLYHEVEADNPLDACAEMIIKLHEHYLL